MSGNGAAGDRRRSRLKWAGLMSAGLMVAATTALAQARILVQSTNVSQPPTNKAFNVVTVTSEVRELLDDFEKHKKRGQWEQAFKVLQQARAKLQPNALLPDPSGFNFPAQHRLNEILFESPADGRDAYRLFNDASAKKLLAGAKGRDEEPILTRVYNEYLLTTSGAVAADRLGDVAFEQGAFAKAIECWQCVLRFHAGGNTPLARLNAKITLALARAERWDEFARENQRLKEKFGGETLQLGGKEVRIGDWVDSLVRRNAARPTAEAALPPNITAPKENTAVWQFRFFDSATLRGMMSQDGWNWNSATVLQGYVPEAVSDNQRIYVNLLGYHFAVDAGTGKLLWRNDKFHTLMQRVRNRQGIFAEQYHLLLQDGKLFAVSREATGIGNVGLPFRIMQLDPVTGKTLWDSARGELREWSIFGVPLIQGDKLYAAALRPNRGNELFAVAMQVGSDRLLWNKALGMQVANPMQQHYIRVWQPSLVMGAGRLYLQSNTGTLFELDPQTGDLTWAFDHESEIVSTEYWWNRAAETLFSGPLFWKNGVLFAKGMRSSRLYAIQTGAPKVLWQRPVAQASFLFSVDDERIILAGDELQGIDVSGQKLLWSAPLPASGPWVYPLRTRGQLVQFTPRGVFIVDPTTGKVRSIFRGVDLESFGGRILVTPKYFVTVSNNALSAYPWVAEPHPGRQP